MKAGQFRQRRPFIIPKTNAAAIAVHRICHIADEYISAGKSEDSPMIRATAAAETNTMLSVRFIVRVVSLSDCHAFSLDEPTGTTYGSKHYDFRYNRKSSLHDVADQ